MAGRDGAGSAHGALLRAGRIPDPFYGMNEQAVQWVGDKTWSGACAFALMPIPTP